MAVESMAHWLLWWTMRGRGMSCISGDKAEQSHFGVFLREAEIQWRRHRDAISAFCATGRSAIEARGLEAGHNLQAWWETVSATLVEDAQSGAVRLIGEVNKDTSGEMAALRKLYALVVDRPSWKSGTNWERARAWSAKVSKVIGEFAATPLAEAPTLALPFDPGSNPFVNRPLRFGLNAMLGVLGKENENSTGIEPAKAHELEGLLKEALAGDVSIEHVELLAAALAMSIHVHHATNGIPRVFHEFCMDLAASSTSAFLALDGLLARPSQQELQRAAGWLNFCLWDWVLMSGGTLVPNGESKLDFKEYEVKDGLHGWFRTGGIPSSQAAYQPAVIVSFACEALSKHLLSGGIQPTTPTTTDVAPRSNKAPFIEVLSEPKGAGIQ